jgi:hypothetical protein
MKYLFSFVLSCILIPGQAQQQQAIQKAMDSIRIVSAREQQMESSFTNSITLLRNDFIMRLNRISDSLQSAKRLVSKLQTELKQTQANSKVYAASSDLVQLKREVESLRIRTGRIDFHLRKSRNCWTTSLVLYGLATFVALSATAILSNDPHSETPNTLYPGAAALFVTGVVFSLSSRSHIGNLRKAPADFK